MSCRRSLCLLILHRCSVAFRLVVPPIYNHQITSRFTELAYALRFSNFKFTLHTSGSTSWMSLLHVISVTRHILFFLVFALLSHAVLPPSHVKKKKQTLPCYTKSARECWYFHLFIISFTSPGLLLRQAKKRWVGATAQYQRRRNCSAMSALLYIMRF